MKRSSSRLHELLGSLGPGTGARPLEGKSVYLHAVKSRHAAALTDAIRRLGGSMEAFLNRDVSLVVTGHTEGQKTLLPVGGAKPMTPPRVMTSPGGAKPMASPLLTSMGGANPVTPPRTTFAGGAKTATSPLVTSVGGAKLLRKEDRSSRSASPSLVVPQCGSRGRALLEKAMHNNERCRSNDVLANARSWGVKILSVDDFMWCLDFLTERSKQRKTPQTKTSQAPAKRVVKAGTLKSPFIKIEDSSRRYRPFYMQSLKLPELNYKSRYSPFELPTGHAHTSHAHKPKHSPQQGAPENRNGSVHSSAEAVVSPSVKPARKKSSGYCECCQQAFSDMEQHVKSELHVRFSEDSSNYAVVDKMIGSLDCPLLFRPASSQELLLSLAQSSTSDPQPALQDTDTHIHNLSHTHTKQDTHTLNHTGNLESIEYTHTPISHTPPHTLCHEEQTFTHTSTHTPQANSLPTHTHSHTPPHTHSHEEQTFTHTSIHTPLAHSPAMLPGTHTHTPSHTATHTHSQEMLAVTHTLSHTHVQSPANVTHSETHSLETVNETHTDTHTLQHHYTPCLSHTPQRHHSPEPLMDTHTPLCTHSPDVQTHTLTHTHSEDVQSDTHTLHPEMLAKALTLTHTHNTDMHTQTHTLTDTHNTDMHTQTQIHTLTDTHNTDMPTHTQTLTDTHSTDMHTHTHTLTDTHTDSTDIPTHTLTDMHTHTHTITNTHSEDMQLDTHTLHSEILPKALTLTQAHSDHMPTHTLTDMLTDTHIPTHTNNTDMPTHTQMHTLTQVHTHTHTLAETLSSDMPTHTLTHSEDIPTHTLTLSHTHSGDMHTHTHTLTHTHSGDEPGGCTGPSSSVELCLVKQHCQEEEPALSHSHSRQQEEELTINHTHSSNTDLAPSLAAEMCLVKQDLTPQQEEELTINHTQKEELNVSHPHSSNLCLVNQQHSTEGLDLEEGVSRCTLNSDWTEPPVLLPYQQECDVIGLRKRNQSECSNPVPKRRRTASKGPTPPPTPPPDLQEEAMTTSCLSMTASCASDAGPPLLYPYFLYDTPTKTHHRCPSSPPTLSPHTPSHTRTNTHTHTHTPPVRRVRLEERWGEWGSSESDWDSDITLCLPPAVPPPTTTGPGGRYRAELDLLLQQSSTGPPQDSSYHTHLTHTLNTHTLTTR